MCQFTTTKCTTMSISLNSVMTYNSIVMKTKLGHSLKSIFDDRNGLPFFSMTYTNIHSLTHCFFSSSKENCFFSNVFVPKKVNAIWAHINIPYYTSFNTQLWVRLIVSYMCESYARISSLSLYLYKYHLSVHVYIYLTNSIYLQIGGVQYFLLINRTYRFTYCFLFFLKPKPFHVPSFREKQKLIIIITLTMHK